MQEGRLTITAIEEVEEEVTVYDIEVEMDHSFFVHGAVLHNCARCAGLDGKVWDFDGKPIRGNTLPFPGASAHWNDRCALAPATKTWEELTGIKGLDDIPPGQRASMGGPVSGDTTYQGWFDGLDADEQRDILGPGRYEAVKKRGLLLTDLVDQRGNELTLAELARK